MNIILEMRNMNNFQRSFHILRIIIIMMIIVIWFILSICPVPVPANPGAAVHRPQDQVNVLVIYSWFKDMPWQNSFETGLKRKISEKKLPVQLYVEHIDSSRVPFSEIKDAFHEFLKAKYSGIRIDMVISESLPAVRIMEQTAGLFPNARKLAVQSPMTGDDIEETEMWRILMKQDLTKAIISMVQVYAPTRIAVVAGLEDETSQKRLADFKQSLKLSGITLPVSCLTSPSLDDILESTSKLPPQSAIFYLLYFHDSKGNRVTPFEIARQISQKANAPVFSHWDSLMGSGIVGGCLLSGEKVGETAADAISAFIENKTWTSPTHTNIIYENQYDFRQLQRWGINGNRLPEGSRILYRTPGIFDTHPITMTLILTFICLLVIFVLILSVEIRRRKRISERLAESDERLKAIFRASPDPVVVFDAKGNALHLNQEFKHLLGWNLSNMENGNLPFIDKDSQQDMQGMIGKVSASGGPFKLQIKGMTRDGKSLDMIASASMVRGKDGENTGLLMTLTDISEQKKLEQQLIQSQKMESVGRLAGGVAHDFNNMLSVILGNTDILLEDIDPGNPLKDGVMEIHKAAQRSTDLVRQLLAFARKQAVSPKVLDLNSTIENMMKMLERLIGEDIYLTWLPSQGLWPVKIDPSQVDQLLANLSVNARDAIPGKGRIVIETNNASLDRSCSNYRIDAVPGDYVMLSFSDNGCGMDKNTLDKLFEPFFTTKEEGKGTGLGLSMIYGIVKQNHGTIHLYSEPGQGTTFRIYLPRHTPDENHVDQKVVRTVSETGTETILLVEDEMAILKMTEKILRQLGYRVLSASSPSEALDLLDSPGTGETNLLMTDVVMPGMNGRELFEIITEKFPGMKCLYTSGYTADIIAHHGILDLDDEIKFISKPFSRAELSEIIRKALHPSK